MNIDTVFKNKITLIVAVLTAIHLLWDYYHGGVPTHHLLVSEDMPGFSNWWGLLTLPLLTWGAMTWAEKRIKKRELLNKNTKEGYPEILVGFFGALTFGIIMSIFWELGLEEVLQYVILLPLVISLFKPLHFPEYLLGFVLGMAVTFGGVLPIIFGVVILLMCFIIYKIRQGVLFLIAKM